MDYIVTFIYGDEKNKIRVNNSLSEKDAIRSATVKARILGIPHLENSLAEVVPAAYQKKQNNTK
jgi:hypothetical protein